eukprot:sb/3473538/
MLGECVSKGSNICGLGDDSGPVTDRTGNSRPDRTRTGIGYVKKRPDRTGPDSGISDRDYGDLLWIYPFYITVHTIEKNYERVGEHKDCYFSKFTQNKLINETNLIQSGLNTVEKSRSNPGQKSLSGHRTGIFKNRCPVTGIPVGYCSGH